MDIHQLEPRYFYESKKPLLRNWYAKCEFAYEKNVTHDWLLLRKEPVPGSFSKWSRQQERLLSDVERVPSVSELVWGITNYKAVRNVYLFSSMHVRTSTPTSPSYRVCIGYFDEEGFTVSDIPAPAQPDNLGITSCLKWK